jgi:2-oxoisovalerate dehydrogenase E1 component alpha subunit
MTAAIFTAPATVASAERHPEDVTADDVVRLLGPDGKLRAGVSAASALSDGDLVELYRAMVRTRIVDERAVLLQRQGRIGFHIGSLGEEAAILGSAWAMRPGDWIFPCYREFGAALLRGMPLQRYFDNLYGNQNDVVKGRQMPDHWCYRQCRLASVSSPIGTQIVHATGFAWAAKIRREDVAVLSYFGDGATSSSDFHNGLNFAGVFKAPTIFLCRNNGWAISVPTERQTASRTFAEKGIAYGIPGVRVDGNDLFAVISVTRQAVARAARGEGATLVEALTYRMGGHSTSDDPNRYRGRDLLEPWVRRDPIERVKSWLRHHELWTDAEQEALQAEVDRELREAVAIAEKVPPPPLETLFEDVYDRPPWHLIEQRQALVGGPRAPGHG